MTIDWASLHGQAFTGQRVLVTGGAGFIGSHLTEALLDLGASVMVIDDLSGGDWDNLAPLAGRFGEKLEFIKGTILDESSVARAIVGAQLVYHEAALGSVPRSVNQPRHFHAVNTTGTVNVLEAARSAGVRRVVFAASSSAYGDSPTLPKVETMPPLPRSPYAANKVACEALMMAYSASFELDTACLRYFNIFGPRQNANSAYAAVIAAFAKAITNDQPPIIHGDGEQSRDFTYVANAVHANLLAGRSEAPLQGAPINVAVGERTTVLRLARKMAEMWGLPHLKPVHEGERAGDVKHSLADMSRARELLGYEPVVSFEDGLRMTVEWYKRVLSKVA